MLDMATKKKPGKQSKRQLGLRFPEELIDRAEVFAEKHRRTLTSVVEDALEEFLDKYGDAPSLREQGL